ncbi:innexin shaking-B-like [Amblyomma americanum]
MLDTYCWIHSTYITTTKSFESHLEHVTNSASSDTIYMAYYQWVPFMMLLQGLTFYVPGYLWKRLENGHLASLIVLTDRFLRNNFLTYGIHYAYRKSQLFPLVTNGYVIKMDALCILPLNIINEKVYLFLWIWFISLLGVSLFACLWRCAEWFVTPLRTLDMIVEVDYKMEVRAFFCAL